MTVQFRSGAQGLQREQATPSIAIRHLESEQQDLKDRLARLRLQANALQRGTLASSVTPGDSTLDEQRLAAGLVAVHGPGIIVTLDDSTRPMAPSDNANDYLVHDYDLRDVVSVAWLAGAEAVSINGERLINTSSLYCVGSTILVNDTRLSPPYDIRIIGNSSMLEQVMRNPNNLGKLRAQVSKNGVQFRLATAKDISVPAHTANLGIKLARPLSPDRAAQAAERVRAEGN